MRPRRGVLAGRPLIAPARARRALLGCEPPTTARLLGLGGVLGLGLLAGGCADPASGAQGSCAAQDVGEARCRAIVNEAGTRLPQGGAPIIATEVRIPTLADRETLREQQPVAPVRT